MNNTDSTKITTHGLSNNGKVSDIARLNPETATLEECTAALRKLLKASPNNPSKLDVNRITIQESKTIPNHIALCYIADDIKSDMTASTMRTFDNWTRPFRKSDSVRYGDFRKDRQVELIAETWLTPVKFATLLNEKMAEKGAERS